MNKIKTLTRYALYILLCFCFSNCTDSEKREEPKETKELVLETEHCRYYCMERNGYRNCKIIVCECDQGFSCDASTSW